MSSTSRLYNILSALQSFTDVSKNLGEAWSEILDLKGMPDYEIYKKDAEIRALIFQSRSEAENYGDNNLNNPWLKHFDTIINIFQNVSLKSLVNEVIKVRGFEGALIGLESCAYALSKNQEPEIEKEQLEELIKEIGQLYEHAREVNFPQDIKRYILENLSYTMKVIVDFKINGSEVVRRAIDANIGLLFINHNKINETKEGQGFFSRTIGILNKANTLFSFYKNTSDALQSLQSFVENSKIYIE